jgi:hypothetical protein
MTADERATLAKAERLLAYVRCPECREAVGWEPPAEHAADCSLGEALTLLRGLLAEPQPDDLQARLLRHRTAELEEYKRAALSRDMSPEFIAEFEAMRARLAEPQVNPSETKTVKALRFYADPANWELHETPSGWSSAAGADDGERARAGLLAEGEEADRG